MNRTKDLQHFSNVLNIVWKLFMILKGIPILGQYFLQTVLIDNRFVWVRVDCDDCVAYPS